MFARCERTEPMRAQMRRPVKSRLTCRVRAERSMSAEKRRMRDASAYDITSGGAVAWYPMMRRLSVDCRQRWTDLESVHAG